MQLDDHTRVQHMRDACQTAISFAEGENRESLEHDQKLVFALVRAVEIIGEAASRITPEFRRQESGIPWAAIIGMRNRIIHAYFDVDLDQVWRAVTEDVPSLLAELQKILPADEETDG